MKPEAAPARPPEAGLRAAAAHARSPARWPERLKDGPAQKLINIGGVCASAQPLEISTLLGSCVAVCLFDPVAAIGGMNHILLPHGGREDGGARFGVHAMELLINEMMKLGAQRSRFLAKAFGAGKVLACLRPPTAGDRNAQFVRSFLQVEGIPLISERLGGVEAVKVRFHTHTGRAMVQPLQRLPMAAVLAREQALGQADGTISLDSQTTIF